MVKKCYIKEKPFVFAFYGLIFYLLLSFVSYFFESNFPVQIVLSILGLISCFFVFFGLFSLGKKYKSKKIKYSSVIGFGIFIFLNIVSFFIYPFISELLLALESATFNFSFYQIFILILSFVGFLGLLVNFIFLCIGFLEKSKKVKYFKIVGILGLVSIGLFITILGSIFAIVLLMILFCYLLLIFYEEMKK